MEYPDQNLNKMHVQLVVEPKNPINTGMVYNESYFPNNAVKMSKSMHHDIIGIWTAVL